MNDTSLLILGHGYTGTELMRSQSEHAVATSRSESGLVRFDLADQSSWSNLPRASRTAWLFPAVPLAQVKRFHQQCGSRLGRLVVVGTTGALQIDRPHQWVDSGTGLSSDLARVEGERYLLRQGAILILAAGIYGPGRNPIDWVRRGWVGPSERFVNFIHVSDLVGIIHAALERGRPGQTYLAADGRPHRWRELCQHWHEAFGLPIGAAKEGKRPSKRCRSEPDLEQLGYRLKFPDVLVGVRSLQDQTDSSNSSI